MSNIILVILYVIQGRKPQLCRREVSLPGQKWLVLSVGSAPSADPGGSVGRGMVPGSPPGVGVHIFKRFESKAWGKAHHRFISEQESGFRCHSRSDQKSWFH